MFSLDHLVCEPSQETTFDDNQLPGIIYYNYLLSYSPYHTHLSFLCPGIGVKEMNKGNSYLKLLFTKSSGLNVSQKAFYHVSLQHSEGHEENVKTLHILQFSEVSCK